MRDELENFIRKNKCTLLGVGPMSLNCVDATIELSNRYDVNLMLIASRRQIDSEEFGKGYVNNWSTKEFADYVKKNDTSEKIYLARDHGGPWQNLKESQNKLDLKQAMESAKLSFKNDIDAGFKILHIDPSIDIFNNPSNQDVLDRLFELYEYCYDYSIRTNKQIIFEIGTEEQTGSTNRLEELEFNLEETNKFCSKNNFPKPTFIVVQTGTRVMETKNIGSFDKPLRVENEIPAEIQVPKMIEICKKYSILMKEHNTDYLSDNALKWHPRLGIHAANVAPEFGVAETKAFLRILKNNNLNKLVEEFIKLSYESKKWEKWMLPETKASDYEKAIISGHYIFSNKKFIEIKNKAAISLKKKSIYLDKYLKNEVKKSILRYLNLFRIIK